MVKKRAVILLSLFIFIFVGEAFSGELISKEAKGYYEEAVKAQKAGNFALAETNYTKTLLVDPYNTDWQKFILNNRGVMFAQAGDLDESEKLFKQALKIDPHYRTPQLNLGFIFEKRRTELESIKYWLKVLNIDIEKAKPKGLVIEDGVK